MVTTRSGSKAQQVNEPLARRPTDFNDLPNEMQHQIWECTLPSPGPLIYAIENNNDEPILKYTGPIPIALSICVQSRDYASRQYRVKLSNLWEDENYIQRIHYKFHFSHHTLYVPFTPYVEHLKEYLALKTPSRSTPLGTGELPYHVDLFMRKLASQTTSIAIGAQHGLALDADLSFLGNLRRLKKISLSNSTISVERERLRHVRKSILNQRGMRLFGKRAKELNARQRLRLPAFELKNNEAIGSELGLPLRERKRRASKGMLRPMS